jgi:integrase/recombinase XerD
MMSTLNAKIYKLNTGLLQVSYHNPLNGKRQRKKFGSQKEANVYREILENHYRVRNMSHFSEAHVGNLIERHLKENPNSRFMDRKNSFESFCHEFNGVRLNRLTRPALKQWFDKIQKTNDYSDRTLSAIKTQINYLFRDLVDVGLLTTSPLDQIKFKRVVAPKRARIVMSVAEVKTILENAKTFSPLVLFPYLSCVAHTGARRGEIVRLNREDVDLPMKLIQFKRTKNGRNRFVRISPTLEHVLNVHLATTQSQAVICSNHDKRINSRGELPRLMTKFKAFFPMEKSGWGSHSLRHSFAYNFLKSGRSMYQLQAILGHRSIDVTIDLYGQLQAQDVECPSPYETSTAQG